MSTVPRVDGVVEGIASGLPSPATDTTLVEPKDVESCQEKPRRDVWVSRWLSGLAKRSSERDEEEVDAYAPMTKSLEGCPDGYPKIAMFQSSDRNFLQYRGFRESHCRVLSGLQHEVEQLEGELEQIDEADKTSSAGRAKLSSKVRDDKRSADDLAAGTYPSNVTRSRPAVLSILRTKLLEYDEFLLRTREMCSLQRPSKRDYESVRMWFRDEKPVVTREAQFIRRKGDLVTLRTGRECAGFDSFIERCLGTTDKFLRRSFRCKLVQYLFLTPELRMKSTNGDVRYYSPSRVDALVNIIITVVIFILLVLPVVVLYEITNFAAEQSALDAIGVLIIFTLIFGMAISTLTTARRQELFGASAAYCAVLVVFISNFGVQQVEMVPCD